jgi:hypothetical protein
MKLSPSRRRIEMKEDDRVEHSKAVDSEGAEIDLGQMSSPALARIMEEVQNESASTTRAYDRVHNRHNR